VLRAEVRRHDDDGVAEIDALAASVGEPPLVERLEEEGEEAGRRLFHLVEQQHRVRVVAQLVGQDPATLGAHDPARHADELVDGHHAVLVLGHVHADHLPVVAEQELRHRLCQLRLADSRRTEEEQHAVRAIESVLERSLVQDQAMRHRFDGIALPNESLRQLPLDLLEAIGDVAEHHVFRNSRHAGNHRHHVAGLDLPLAPDFRADRGGVEPPNHLVGQVQVPHVAGRHLDGGVHGLVEDLD